jgi:hypothetical protein
MQPDIECLQQIDHRLQFHNDKLGQPRLKFLQATQHKCISLHCHSLLDSEWPACWRIVVPWGSLAQCPAHPKIFFNNGRRHALARGCFEKQFPALRGRE